MEPESAPTAGPRAEESEGASGESGGSTPRVPEEMPASSELCAAVEAMLLTSPRAVSAQRLAQALGLVPTEEGANGPGQVGAADPRAASVDSAAGSLLLRASGSNDGVRRIHEAIACLNRQYHCTGRSFRIEAVAGGFRIMTLPAFGRLLAAFHGSAPPRLSRAALETLAIIAYRQPITRAQVEAIRGVGCGEVLSTLLERRLITITGRAEELGRPLLYGTTRQFLEAFGLASLKDLPALEELPAGP